MTISFRSIDNFDCIPKEDAENIIYNELLPLCETTHIHLSSYGNDSGKASKRPLEAYEKNKPLHKLFDIEKIQKAFTYIPLYMKSTSLQLRVNSSLLKREIETKQNASFSHGDVIVAALMRGFTASFQRLDEPTIDCQFHAEWIAKN